MIPQTNDYFYWIGIVTWNQINQKQKRTTKLGIKYLDNSLHAVKLTNHYAYKVPTK